MANPHEVAMVIWPKGGWWYWRIEVDGAVVERCPQAWSSAYVTIAEAQDARADYEARLMPVEAVAAHHGATRVTGGAAEAVADPGKVRTCGMSPSYMDRILATVNRGLCYDCSRPVSATNKFRCEKCAERVNMARRVRL